MGIKPYFEALKDWSEETLGLLDCMRAPKIETELVLYRKKVREAAAKFAELVDIFSLSGEEESDKCFREAVDLKRRVSDAGAKYPPIRTIVPDFQNFVMSVPEVDREYAILDGVWALRLQVFQNIDATAHDDIGNLIGLVCAVRARLRERGLVQ